MYNYENKYIAAIYCRLSKDDEQAGESVSIETQKIMLTSFCQENNFSVYKIYVDDGYSGLNFNRPAFIRLIEDIENGKVNIVVTKDLSRLGRDYIQTGYYTDIYFKKNKVRYIAVNDGVDTESNDNDITPFKNILNDMYAKDLSRKIKTSKRQRAYKGYHISGQTPYGYKVDPTDKNHLVIDEEAANVVRKIYQLALEGYNHSQISRILKQKKIITPSAYKLQNGDTRFIKHITTADSVCDWSYQTVRGILINRVYVGDMVNHKYETVNYKTKEQVRVPDNERIIVKNRHEAIVSREMFEKVQTVLRRREKNNNYNNVFKGLVLCAECGKPMYLIASTKRSKTKPQFLCNNHRINPECCTRHHAVYYDDLYEIVLNKIKKHLLDVKNEVFVERLKNELDIQRYTEQAVAKEEDIRKRLNEIKKDIKQLNQDFIDKLISTELYYFRLSGYMDKQKKLIVDLAEVKISNDNLEYMPKPIISTDSDLQKCFEIDELTEDIVKRLISRIEIGHNENSDRFKLKQTINIYYRFKNPTEE